MRMLLLLSLTALVACPGPEDDSGTVIDTDPDTDTDSDTIDCSAIPPLPLEFTTIEGFSGAEDFAFLAREAPGCFFWLGAGIEDDRRSHHSPRFDIDESCLPRGAAVLAAAACKVLAEW